MENKPVDLFEEETWEKVRSQAEEAWKKAGNYTEELSHIARRRIDGLVRKAQGPEG